MKKNMMFGALALSASICFAGQDVVAEDGWLTDMDEAMATAAAEDKLLLIDFTGSDWCHWCIRLHEEVFSQSQFKEEVPEDFVLVVLDFPNDKSILTEEQHAHNKAWADKYPIQGYPTIILADANGDMFASTGYRPDGAGPYVEHLDELRNGKSVRDAALDGAAQVDGLARAMLLDRALTVEDILVPDRETVMQDIIDLDPEDLTGLRSQYEVELLDLKIQKRLDLAKDAMRNGNADTAREVVAAIRDEFVLSSDSALKVNLFELDLQFNDLAFEEMNGLIDESLALEDGDAELRQEIASFRVRVALAMGEKDKAIEAYDAMVAVDPDSAMGKSMAEGRENFAENVDQYISQLQGFVNSRKAELESDG